MAQTEVRNAEIKHEQDNITRLEFVPRNSWSAASDAKTNFVVLGDTGTGNDNQKRVAQAIISWKGQGHSIDFVLLAGDNFYPRGLRARCTNEKFLTKSEQYFNNNFIEIYKTLKLSFFPILGNHDYSAACTCGSLKCPEKSKQPILRDLFNKSCREFYGVGGGDVFNGDIAAFQDPAPG